MKKLIGLIVLIALFSCEKLDDTYCWDCTIFFYTQDYSVNELYVEEGYVEKCDYSELDAQKFENSRTTHPRNVSICGDIVRYEDCICEKR